MDHSLARRIGGMLQVKFRCGSPLQDSRKVLPSPLWFVATPVTLGLAANACFRAVQQDDHNARPTTWHIWDWDTHPRRQTPKYLAILLVILGWWNINRGLVFCTVKVFDSDGRMWKGKMKKIRGLKRVELAKIPPKDFVVTYESCKGPSGAQGVKPTLLCNHFTMNKSSKEIIQVMLP